MAVTPAGSPYVESSDLVGNYPGASLALAERVDQVVQAPTQNAITATTYQPVALDAGKTVTLNNAATVTVTIPAQATVAWSANTQLNFLNIGAGTVTITPAADVTINGTPLTLATSKGGSLVRTASNTWTFIPFSAGEGAANFTNTATGTYTDAGISYKFITFTGSGSLVVDRAGFADILVIGGGSGGTSGSHNGMGGYTRRGAFALTAATHTVTIGAGGSGGGNAGQNIGITSSIGSTFLGYGGGGGASSSNFNAFDDSITGVSVNYAGGKNSPTVANRGQGGDLVGSLAGSSGVVIIRVAI